MLQGHNDGLSLSAMHQYMHQVRQIPPLTDEEEARLLLCVASGVSVQEAKDRLVEGYLHLVIKLARPFARVCRQVELLDFVQEGNWGLLRAVEKYDVSKVVASFRTLAFAWIRGSILTAYWRDERAISVPLTKVRQIRQMNAVSMKLLALLGREPTVREIAQEMQLGEQDVQKLVVLQDQRVVSLHTPLEDGETLLEDVLEDATDSTHVDGGVLSAEEVLEILTEREQMVMRLRFGLLDGRAYTQKEVADRLGVASSRVAVLEHRAKMRVRKIFEHQVA